MHRQNLLVARTGLLRRKRPMRILVERYSHIRMNAKRQAVGSLSLKPKAERPPQRSPQSEGQPRDVAPEKVV